MPLTLSVEASVLIEDQTVLLPIVVADSVIRELAYYMSERGIAFNVDMDALAEKLAKKADREYAINEYFRKGITARGRDGRAGLEFLLAFMRHWLSAEFPHSSEVHRNLPEGFCVGATR